MLINGQPYRTIWIDAEDSATVHIIDQRHLPHQLVLEPLRRVADFECAIRDMHVRGAPLIGATAAYGLYIATLEAPANDLEGYIESAAAKLRKTRPTAVDLFYALDRSLRAIRNGDSREEKSRLALEAAQAFADESAAGCRRIGEYGLQLIREIARRKKGQPVNVLTHCNAGWLACIDYGTATAPLYLAHDEGIPVHVWVDETRPRNQGARITAYELLQHGLPHTVIPDNTGGHLMQHGKVDLVIVGTDRTTYDGDVANKIGTYLKALAAQDNGVPFYVALPSSTIDWNLREGLKTIPIEERNPEEVQYIQGWNGERIERVRLTPEGSPAVNYGFDVTPARLVTGLITERGICAASREGIAGLFPQKAKLEGVVESKR